MARGKLIVLCVGVLAAAGGALGARQGVVEIAAAPFTITNSGSYYLSDNLFVGDLGGGAAIGVLADDVTVDLNGFMLAGKPGTYGYGIYQAATNRNLTVCNGLIVSFGADSDEAGIHAGGANNVIRNVQVSRCWHGIYSTERTVVEGCLAVSNSQIGIRVGGGSVVAGCSAVNNGGSGIYGSSNCVVKSTLASDNGGYGIDLGGGGCAVDCQAESNGGCGIRVGKAGSVTACRAVSNSLDGIHAEPGAAIRSCVVAANGGNGIFARTGGVVAACSAVNNGNDGIVVQDGSRVQGCTASMNQSSGIRASGWSCYIEGCLAVSNLHSGVLAGSGSGLNRIEGNHLCGNAYGIYENGSSNLIIKNYATANTNTDYFVNGSGTLCPLSTNGSIAVPWVNFVY